MSASVRSSAVLFAVAATLVVAGDGGCISSGTTACGDQVCPRGARCIDARGAKTCVLPWQLTACDGRAEGESCDTSTALGYNCVDGVCLKGLCGDGVHDVGEECDEGSANSDTTPDACRANCTIPRCGDGVVDARYHEACDDGAANSDTTADACRTNCQPARCGDGQLDAGEVCDDGNTEPGDGCAADCLSPCGDGVINSGRELCDGGAPPQTYCRDFGFDFGRLGCNNQCTLDFTSCGHLGWRPLPPVTDAVLRRLWGTGPADVWAVGAEGVILHYDGDTWSVSSASATGLPALYGVWAAAPGEAWAVGTGGALWHHRAGAWSDISATIDATDTLFGIWGSAPDDIWVVGGRGRVFRGDGSVWTEQFPPFALPSLLGVWGSSADDVWMVGSSGTIVHYEGGTWTDMSDASLPTIWGVHGTSASNVWTSVGQRWDGTRWRSAVMRRATMGAPVLGQAVWTSGPSNTWVVQYLQSHHFDGSVWLHLPDQGFRSVWGAHPGEVWAVQDNRIYRHRGAQWVAAPQTRVATEDLTEVWGSGGQDIWAAGRRSTILHWNGLFWETHDPGFSLFTDLSALWGSGPSSVWFGYGGWKQLHYDGGAFADVDPNPPISTATPDLWGFADDDIWSAARSGYIGHRTTGAFLPDQVAAPDVDLLSIWGTGPNDLWAVGVAGGSGVLLHRDAGGWSDHSAELPVSARLSAVFGTGPADVWVVGMSGTMIHYDGANWSDRTDPGVTPVNLQDIGGTSPADYWAVGDAGTLLYYDGQSWTPVATPLIVDLRAVWVMPRHVIIVGEGGTVAHIVRSALGSCAATETCGNTLDDDCDGRTDYEDADCSAPSAEVCGDGLDNDGDGQVDCADADCAAAPGCVVSCQARHLRLTEIYRGAPSYVEIQNVGYLPCDLNGWGLAVDDDTTTTTYVFGSRLLAAGEQVRLVDTPSGLLPNELYLGATLADGPADPGWVALCTGDCDQAACSNLVDYFEKNPGGATLTTALGCASFPNLPVDVAGLTAAEGLTRSSMRPDIASLVGASHDGRRSQWTIAPMTRD